MQAYASAEIAPTAELRFLDHRPTSSDEQQRVDAATGAVVLDELLGQLADLVADRLVARLDASQADAGDEWLDTRGARGVPRHPSRQPAPAWLPSGRSPPSRQAPAASCSSVGRIWMRGAVVDRRRSSASGAGAMADVVSSSAARPGRARDLPAFHWRPRGLLQGRDAAGCAGAPSTAASSRPEGCEMTLRRDAARGESVAPNPKLLFGEAADRWLNGPVFDLRDTTQVKYRSIVDGHLRPRFEAMRLDAHHR